MGLIDFERRRERNFQGRKKFPLRLTAIGHLVDREKSLRMRPDFRGVTHVWRRRGYPTVLKPVAEDDKEFAAQPGGGLSNLGVRMGMAKDRYLVPVEADANCFAKGQVQAGIGHRGVDQGRAGQGRRDGPNHPNSLPDLALAFALTKFVERNADDSSNQLQERITFSILSLSRIRRDRLGRLRGNFSVTT